MRRFVPAIVGSLALGACISDPVPKDVDHDADATTEVTSATDTTSTASETADDSDASETVDDADATETTSATTTETVEDGDVATETASEVVEDTDTVEPDDGDTTSDDGDTTSDDGDTTSDDADAPDTTPSPLALERATSATRWDVGNDRFMLGLDELAGWMPQSLTIADGSGSELLYGALPGDIHEVWIGLSLFDVVHLWNDTTPPTIVEEGPAVLRLRRVSDVDPMNTTIGMTLHADGRLVISADVTIDSPQQNATLVTYTALDIARFSHVQAGSTQWTLPTGQTAAGGVRFLTQIAGITEADYLCARHIVARDAVGFIERGIDGLDEPLPRITEHAGGADAAHSIRLQYDLARDHTPAGFFAGRFLVTFDATGACTRVAAQAAAFRAPPGWSMTTGTLRTEEVGDTDQDGFVEAGAYYAVSAPTRSLSMVAGGGLPALTLRVFGPAWATPSVTVDGTPLLTSEVVSQPAQAGDGGWVVIARSIDAGAVVSLAW